MGPAATDNLGAGRHRRLGSAVGGSVVSNPDRRFGKGAAKGANGAGNPVGLVAGRDEDRERSARFGLESHAVAIVRAMADIEAHITGNVWKIEVAVGDTVADGDTVVILESMKMEIPVEAEDDGTVEEIRCEEGQAVSEGDVLVVLG
jgi:acetyl-CoA carboxylase biotin carboxyl carrier protein